MVAVSPHSEPSKAGRWKDAIIDALAERVRERLSEVERALVERFVRQYYAGVAAEDLVGIEPEDLYGAALAHLGLTRERAPGTHKLRVYNPSFEKHGWQSTHTIVEVVTDDMPFLVDSVGMALNRHGLTVHLVVHPIMASVRDHAGTLVEVLDGAAPGASAGLESLIHAEVDRETDPIVLQRLQEDLDRALGDVRMAVEDWPKMRAALREAARGLTDRPPPIEPAEVLEVRAFLEWMGDGNFVLLGYRNHRLLREQDEEVLTLEPGSGLGILRERDTEAISRSFAELPPELKRSARDPYPLIITKSSSRATVHRPAYLDYVGVKRYGDGGEVIGEHRFLGLHASSAYQGDPKAIPILRRKIERVIQGSGLIPKSYSGRSLLFILESYPREELFQSSEAELLETAMGIMHLRERQRVRLFVRDDPYGRFRSCLVFVPRERYNTELREHMQAIFRHAFGATEVEFNVSLSESPLACIHFIVHTTPGQRIDYDVADLELRLAEATRSWGDRLHAALCEAHGEEAGNELYARYREAFPAAYREDFGARSAIYDIGKLAAAHASSQLQMNLHHAPELASDELILKLYHPATAIPLSAVLPIIENMGVTVTTDRPYEVETPQAVGWIHELRLRHTEPEGFDADRVRSEFQETLARVWAGEAENDGFNRLVLRAGLAEREVLVLRAYCRYLRQIGLTFNQSYIEECLANNAELARRLIDLFRVRFDPHAKGRAGPASRRAAEAEAALDAVAGLDEDRILRSLFALIQATTRTNFYQRNAEGRPKPYLALKLDPTQLPQLPRPRPAYEVYVYSPRTEGVHLRGGKVARGGLRWSDRREDYRTEVLGLMKAQRVKNTLIVPVGAKGGFVLKRPPAAGGARALQAEAVACYEVFIRGLLDVTDNRVDTRVVPPPEVVRYDDDDPYLVVAADKGTATFSDIANRIARDYGFWLGDAFASGGSAGYDHKRMGITARGAWESVKHHASELGLDPERQDFTVVGIGDMGGDVFGNGMLLSRHIKLIGAFNHQHIFLDPTPDAAAGYLERRRLFEQPGAGWGDYDRSLISTGGGVHPRSAKSIALSPEVRQALAIRSEALSPPELIRALLLAPVDLIWNGGIGTFVKAHDEAHAEVGDRGNDAIRVDARELRSRMVAEGGNLGVTQRGRIEYALAGGHINTDAIDNCGGVNCSDREVNIKIPLDAAVARGELTGRQRDELLAAMGEEVARLVLLDSYRQMRALSIAEVDARRGLDWYRRLMLGLERKGLLDRTLEALPADEALAERSAARQGLTRPELAVLLAYAKMDLYPEVLASDMPDDPYLAGVLERYFPALLRERFPAAVAEHRLRREIIATVAVNSLVNRAGITFAERLREITGRDAPAIARAYLAARDLFGVRALWERIDALEGQAPREAQITLLLEIQGLMEQAVRWLLGHSPEPLDIAAAVARYGPAVGRLGTGSLAPLLARHEPPTAREGLDRPAVPPDLAHQVAQLRALVSALDLHEIAARTGLDLTQVASVYFELGERLSVHWLRARLETVPVAGPWQERARADLSDELGALHAALTALVLQAAAREGQGKVEQWVALFRHAIERYQGILAEIKAAAHCDLAMVTVALGVLRGLVQVGPGAAR